MKNQLIYILLMCVLIPCGMAQQYKSSESMTTDKKAEIFQRLSFTPNIGLNATWWKMYYPHIGRTLNDGGASLGFGNITEYEVLKGKGIMASSDINFNFYSFDIRLGGAYRTRDNFSTTSAGLGLFVPYSGIYNNIPLLMYVREMVAYKNFSGGVEAVFGNTYGFRILVGYTLPRRQSSKGATATKVKNEVPAATDAGNKQNGTSEYANVKTEELNKMQNEAIAKKDFLKANAIQIELDKRSKGGSVDEKKSSNPAPVEEVDYLKYSIKELQKMKKQAEKNKDIKTAEKIQAEIDRRQPKQTDEIQKNLEKEVEQKSGSQPKTEPVKEEPKKEEPKKVEPKKEEPKTEKKQESAPASGGNDKYSKMSTDDLKAELKKAMAAEDFTTVIAIQKELDKRNGAGSNNNKGSGTYNNKTLDELKKMQKEAVDKEDYEKANTIEQEIKKRK